MNTPPPSSPSVAADAAPAHELISPVNGELLDRVALASRTDIARILERGAEPLDPWPRPALNRFLHRLADELMEHEKFLVERTAMESGFVRRDCQELVEDVVAFLSEFPVYSDAAPERSQIVYDSYSTEPSTVMRMTHRPMRCVAAVVPQNAALAMSVIILASALHTGSRVVIRGSLQSASTCRLLAELVRKSGAPEGAVEIVSCQARDFMDAVMASPAVDIVHYIGGDRYTRDVLQRAFAAGKSCLVDGPGNGLAYVDASYPLAEAVELVARAITRFNGETCTSINGVLVDESVYGPFRDALVETLSRLRVGDPLDAAVDVGPLFSARHAEGLRRTLAEATATGRIVTGGAVDGAYFTPALVEGVEPSDLLVQEGVFGPAAWLHPVRRDELGRWLGANRYPLCDTVLAMRQDAVEAVLGVSRASRVCVNVDPSIESMFEPWGGYPPGGLNPVSVWLEKYRQPYQLVHGVSPAPGGLRF